MKNYYDAISAVQQAMNSYDPAVIGYSWDEGNPPHAAGAERRAWLY